MVAATDFVDVVRQVHSDWSNEELREDLESHLFDRSMEVVLGEAECELGNIREELSTDTARQSQQELEVVLRDLASEAHVALLLQVFVDFA